MKSHELLDIIGEAQDDYILDAKKPRKKHISAWIKWTAMAACLCLILGMVWLLQPHIPDYPNASYTAYDIAELFEMNTLGPGSTNAYTKVYVPSGECLRLNALPEGETLPIYRYHSSNTAALTQEEWKAFIDETLEKYCDALGIPVPDYELRNDNSLAYIVTPDDRYHIFSWTQPECTSFSLETSYRLEDPTIYLHGHAVQVNQQQTDAEILSSLENVKSRLFEIYGVSFSDAKINRSYNGYSEYGLSSLTVYYFDADAHPLNTIRRYPVSDYIKISFDNVINFEGDTASDTILSRATIQYMDYTESPEIFYPQIANAKMISLAEAEQLLYKGYVFGGHSCPLCMAGQEEISFEGYDYVGLEYVFGHEERDDIVPFYAFYKAIGTSENGNIIYAKTYVPAIEVSGLDEYFENQQQSHNN